MANVKSQEIDVLVSFLKSGLSTRELDKRLGYSSATRGWKSWKILKKYKLKNTDKGKLFVYPLNQSKKIIKNLMENPRHDFIENLIENNQPENLDKYKDTYVITKSEKAFYDIFTGETRNIVQDFFNPLKKSIGKCQFKDCDSHGELDTAHHLSDRRSIFILCAGKFKEMDENGFFKYDVYKVMRCFLDTHFKKRTICFLCKNHHSKFDRLKKSNAVAFKEFKKNIIFD
jgi:putative sterol carrier protein